MINMKFTGRMEFSSYTHPKQKVETHLGIVEFVITAKGKGEGKTRLRILPAKEQKFNKADLSPPFFTSDLIEAVGETIDDNWGLWEMFTARRLKAHWDEEVA